MCCVDASTRVDEAGYRLCRACGVCVDVSVCSIRCTVVVYASVQLSHVWLRFSEAGAVYYGMSG